MSKRKILLAAGGTGGHIIPSLAFGSLLESRGEQVCYLTGSRPLETAIYSANGRSPRRLSLEGSPLGVRGVASAKRWWQLLTAFFEARKIIKHEKIGCCVLFGGYLSFPVLLAARCAGVPVIMHEQNTVAGKVTRIAAKMGVPICTAWKSCEYLPDGSYHYTGMPLRNIRLCDKKSAQARLTGEDDFRGKLIVILGGSLGSGGMKNILTKVHNMIKSTGYRMLFMGIRFEDRPFEDALTHPATWDMTDVYSSADLILCRAGASTLAELEALGIPAVVIPWMKAADGHQEKNARVFSGLTGNPVFIENSSPDAFGEVLKTVNQNTTERADLARGALALYDAMKTLAF